MAFPKIVFLVFFMAIVPLFVLTSVRSETEKSLEDLKSKYLQPPSIEASPDMVLHDADRYAYEVQVIKERNRLFQILGTFITGLLSLALVLFILTRSKDYTAQHLINGSGLVLVIFGTLLVVILADVREQLTASIGIMGAIAGYLFGRIQNGPGDGKSNPQKD